ncbi:MAG: hypothetical protein Q9227_008848 [Pyrenula ochraceoflavens]
MSIDTQAAAAGAGGDPPRRPGGDQDPPKGKVKLCPRCGFTRHPGRYCDPKKRPTCEWCEKKHFGKCQLPKDVFADPYIAPITDRSDGQHFTDAIHGARLGQAVLPHLNLHNPGPRNRYNKHKRAKKIARNRAAKEQAASEARQGDEVMAEASDSESQPDRGDGDPSHKGDS